MLIVYLGLIVIVSRLEFVYRDIKICNNIIMHPNKMKYTIIIGGGKLEFLLLVDTMQSIGT